MLTNKIIAALDAEQMNKTIPTFNPGDTAEVKVKVKEGDRERLQAFDGVVIAKRNSGLNPAFTLRQAYHGQGAERVFLTIPDKHCCRKECVRTCTSRW